MKYLWLCLIIFVVVSAPVKVVGQSSKTQGLSLEDAKRVIAAAEQRARQDRWNVVIVLVDEGGHLIHLIRMDSVQTASIDIAIQKARTATFYKRSTKVFQDRVAAGESALLSLPDMLPFEGGLPIIKEGVVIGAIGVSGVTAEQDGIIAQAGLDAL